MAAPPAHGGVDFFFFENKASPLHSGPDTPTLDLRLGGTESEASREAVWGWGPLSQSLGRPAGRSLVAVLSVDTRGQQAPGFGSPRAASPR